MLTLFTNRREMEQCFDGVHPALKEDDLRLVCQKWGVSVKGLRDDFLKDEHLSLFALKSFWEGFDAPGATLKGVVIPSCLLACLPILFHANVNNVMIALGLTIRCPMRLSR